MTDRFLKSLENTYHDDKYVNVVGDHISVVNFINICKKHNIWTYRLYTVCVYKGKRYKGIFCKKKDIKAIKKIISQLGLNLVLNASNPFWW